MSHFKIAIGLSLLCLYGSLYGCASASHEAPPPSIPVEAGVISADDHPWTEFGEGVRGKVYFSDRMTLLYLEMVDADKRPKYAPHQHDHDQIVYVLEGRSIVQLGDQTREVGPGDVFVVSSNLPHTYNPVTDRVVVIEVFTPTREDFRPK